MAQGPKFRTLDVETNPVKSWREMAAEYRAPRGKPESSHAPPSQVIVRPHVVQPFRKVEETLWCDAEWMA